MIMEFTIDRLIKEAFDRAEENIEFSCLNHHAEGLHYLNLVRTPQFTAKLYHFDNVDHNENGYLVWPHDHAYAFTHFTIAGVVNNRIFETTKGDGWDIYEYDAETHSSQVVGQTGLRERMVTHCPAGEGYRLTTDEIHTISIETPHAAAVLLQFTDTNKGPGTMYAPRGAAVECGGEGMYSKMSAQEYREILKNHIWE